MLIFGPQNLGSRGAPRSVPDTPPSPHHGQQAGGAHPTGMLSSYYYYYGWKMVSDTANYNKLRSINFDDTVSIRRHN